MIKQKKYNLEPCPVCGKKDFYSPATRGTHMRFVHGIKGRSATAKKFRKKKMELELLENPLVKIPRPPKGKVLTQNMESNPIKGIDNEEEDKILQLGISIGRTAERISSHAKEARIPAREFAIRVIEALSREIGG